MQHDHFSSILGPKLILSLLSFTAGVSLAQVCVAAPGEWEATGNLVTARDHHTAALLPNGKVLVVAGGDPGLTGSAELYDPASGTWTATSSLAIGRYLHTETLKSGPARCSSWVVMESPVLSPARNSMTQQAELGQRPTALLPLATNIRRPCSRMARCSSPVALGRARRSR